MRTVYQIDQKILLLYLTFRKPNFIPAKKEQSK